MAESINIQQPLQNPFGHFASKTKGDKVIWALTVLLVLVSLLAVYSANIFI